MRLKILYIITKSDIGGAQKYVADLADNLDKNQFEAKIMYGGQDLKWLSNKVRPWAFFLNDWLAIRELAKTLQKERPAIIHLNSSKAGVLGSLAAFIYGIKSGNHKPKTRVVFTAHGWVFNPTNKLSFLTRWFYILLHKWAAFFQDKIICVSECDRQLALKYRVAPEKKLITIHNGIDPDIRFLDKQTARKELIQKLQPTTSNPRPDYLWIGSIGRLAKEKNYETLIQTAVLVPNTDFLIIGNGPEQQNLESGIKDLKLQTRFFIVKPTGEDHKYLKAFDVFIMTSIKEGCPYILLEAMAAGLPIVVTNAGGMPEIIKNGENGLVVPQKNPEMLARAARKLSENKNKANELGKMARKNVREKFGLGKMVLETETVYKENL